MSRCRCRLEGDAEPTAPVTDVAKPAPQVEKPLLPAAETPPPADPQAQGRRALSEEDLKRQLLDVPEIDPNQVADVRLLMNEYAGVHSGGKRRVNDQNRDKAREDEITKGMTKLLEQAGEAGLPLRHGASDVLEPKAAEALQMLSTIIRSLATKGKGRGGSGPIEPDALRRLLEFTWKDQGVDQRYNVIPTLMQMLQVEDQADRLIMVEKLSHLHNGNASVALAQRALYDLSPKVRGAAIQALKKRRPEEVREVLVGGFRYPWSPVADHAAKALVELRDRRAIPKLVELLDAVDPSLPVFNAKGDRYEVRELVRINHLRNCYLCHAPSYNTKDMVRGRVPTPGVALPRAFYQDQTGAFIRADVTYLKQDFSVIQTVKASQPWPEQQRYDYLVRTRVVPKDQVPEAVVKREKLEPSPNYPQRELVLITLKQLSGREAGTSAPEWRQFLQSAEGVQVFEPAKARQPIVTGPK
jgi:hypothetical protein